MNKEAFVAELDALVDQVCDAHGWDLHGALAVLQAGQAFLQEAVEGVAEAVAQGDAAAQAGDA